jgi:hypothetical protein
VWTVSLGTPVLAFAGGLTAQVITRRGDEELEHRSKREEVMRILRWAAELAVSDHDDPRVRLGVAQLGVLMRSELLDEGERDFVQAALEAAVRVPVEAIEQAGEDAHVVVTTDLPPGTDVDISSDEEPKDQEGNS